MVNRAKKSRHAAGFFIFTYTTHTNLYVNFPEYTKISRKLWKKKAPIRENPFAGALQHVVHYLDFSLLYCYRHFPLLAQYCFF